MSSARESSGSPHASPKSDLRPSESHNTESSAEETTPPRPMKRRRLSDNMRIQNLERAFKATETQNLQIVELLAQVVKKLHSEEKERSNSSVPESEKEANLEGGEETEDTLSDGYLSEGSTASDSVNPLPPLSFHTKKTDADVLETPNSLSEIVPRDGEFLQDMPLDKTDLGIRGSYNHHFSLVACVQKM